MRRTTGRLRRSVGLVASSVIRNRKRDVLLPVSTLRREPIVSAAQQPEIVRSRATSAAFWYFVVEFEKSLNIATPPVVCHERATPSVAPHYLATCGTSHVRIPRRTLLPRRPTRSSFSC